MRQCDLIFSLSFTLVHYPTNTIGREPKNIQESSLSDDVYVAFQEFCAEFSCKPSVLIIELRKLSSKDQADIIKAARQRLRKNKKPISNLGGFAFTTVQRLVSAFLSGDRDFFDAKTINQEVNSLIEKLGWSNAQRAAILLERHQVYGFSELSPNQKQDFCNYLRSMISSSPS